MKIKEQVKLEGRSIISSFDRKRPSVKVGYVICYLIAVAVAVSTLYPLIWVFLGSLKDAKEIFRMPPTFLPDKYLWGNYLRAWQVYEIPRVFKNTVFVFAGFTFVRLVVLSTAAYAFSHLKLPFRHGLYLIFLATLMLPFFAYIIPAYLVVFQLGLLDSFWGIWLPAGADSFSLLLLKNFFDGIPQDLFEAAKIDGASELKILRKIVIPLSKPIVAVLGIFAFMHVWKDFLWQRIILTSASNWTISIALWYRSLSDQGAVLPQNVQLAGLLLSTLPPAVIFVIFQKYIIQGVTFSGLKS